MSSPGIPPARALERGLAVVGAVMVVLVAVGLAIDVASLDRTRGAIEPPYADVVGTPIDWDAADVTSSGFARRGLVLNALVDCTVGTVGIEVYGVVLAVQPLSDRALVVHRPREACVERGFSPRF